MKTVAHTCPPEASELAGGESIEEIAESVDELREKLANMKKLMEEKKGSTLGEISAKKRKETSDIIDGHFLSWVFGLALIVILSVSFYAFYNLYDAVLRKFPSHHTELSRLWNTITSSFARFVKDTAAIRFGIHPSVNARDSHERDVQEQWM